MALGYETYRLRKVRALKRIVSFLEFLVLRIWIRKKIYCTAEKSLFDRFHWSIFFERIPRNRVWLIQFGFWFNSHKSPTIFSNHIKRLNINCIWTRPYIRFLYRSATQTRLKLCHFSFSGFLGAKKKKKKASNTSSKLNYTRSNKRCYSGVCKSHIFFSSFLFELFFLYCFKLVMETKQKQRDLNDDFKIQEQCKSRMARIAAT